jgi:hypothetical protein
MHDLGLDAVEQSPEILRCCQVAHTLYRDVGRIDTKTENLRCLVLVALALSAGSSDDVGVSQLPKFAA